MRQEVLLEFRKTAARKSLWVLLGLATLLTVVFHFSMRAEVDYLIEGAADHREFLDRNLQSGNITESEYRERIASADEGATRAAFEEEALLFPDSLRMGMQTLATAGGLFIALGAALSFGSEHSWGTYRNLVSVSRSRRRVLLTQLLGYLLVVLVALVATVALAAVLGLVESLAQVQQTPRFSTEWTALTVTGLGTMLVIVLWAGVGLVAAVLGRSAGPAVSIAALVWVTNLFTPLLGSTVRRWSLDSVTVPLLSFGNEGRVVHGLFVPAGYAPASAPAAAVATLILVGLIGAVLAAAVLRFQRIDII